MSDEPHHHHLVPRCRGGSDEETNLVTLCVECHGLLHGVEWQNNHAQLTRDGLQRAKARGQKLGGDRGDQLTDKARALGCKARTAQADARAADLAPIVAELQASGVTSLRGIAKALNERGIQTPRGTGAWQAGTVAQLLARMPG
jgi:hypothetical protein